MKLANRFVYPTMTKIISRLTRPLTPVLILLGGSATAFAQAQPKPPTQAKPPAPTVDPNADRVLRQMSDFLGSRPQFTVHSESTIEVVLSSGEKIQYELSADAAVKRPDRLRATRKGDLHQELFYDGKSLTLYNKKENVYATVPAPSTIERALDMARNELDMDAPGGDLLYRNLYASLMEDVISGTYLGTTVIDGVPCFHLAYRGNDTDWQIWVAQGDKPIPKKYVITSKRLAGAPEFTVLTSNWDLSPDLDEKQFVFVPPKGSQGVDFIKIPREPTSGARP